MTDSLPLAIVISILGIPVRFATNSASVHEMVLSTFGEPSLADGALLHVRIDVREGDEGPQRPTRIEHILPDARRLILRSPGSVGIVDPARREALAFVTTELVAEREQFRDSVLRALTLALVAQFDRLPIHAAAIAANDRAILLAGPSGAGKSTLAHLALEAGFDVLTDERAWIQLHPSLHVWAERAPIRLLSGGAEKTLVALPRRLGARDVYSNAKVCLLARGTHPVLDALAPEEVARELSNQLTPGFDRFPERHDAAVRALADAGGWRLTLSSDPTAALPLLRRLLKEP